MVPAKIMKESTIAINIKTNKGGCIQYLKFKIQDIKVYSRGFLNWVKLC